MRTILLAAMACGCACGQVGNGPAFEAASLKPASPTPGAIRCGGGPGTAGPGTWTCSNVPLAFLISNAYGFLSYEFSPLDRCCQARFDVAAKLAPGTTKEQFQQMQQRLLTEGFQLALHHERKEVEVYELTLGPKGLRMKESAPGAVAARPEPWSAPKFTMGDDGYPVFPAGQGGLIGMGGHYRWSASGLTMPEIAGTLAGQLGKPVIDATGLAGRYEVNLTWIVDISWALRAAAQASADAPRPEADPGPTLERAVENRLGLKLTSAKGPGSVVVIDHAEKIPAAD